MLPPDSGDWDHLYSSKNTLILTNPEKFQNTALIEGALQMNAGNNAQRYGASRYFRGYVFRGDSRLPRVIFQSGFGMQIPLESENQLPTLTGAVGGITGSEGISTSICVQAAVHYAKDPRFPVMMSGCVYLIDATSFTGFSMPTPRPAAPVAINFPILNQIYEVNFMHSIPNTSIVGVVWPAYALSPIGVLWSQYPQSLRLAVNPEYEGGMAGAQAVVKLFNS